MALQIARAMHLSVTAVCSAPNVDIVHALGATRVIDYTRQDPLRVAQRFHAVFDCIGRETFWKYRRLLLPGGRHIGISGRRRLLVDSAISRLTPGRQSLQFHVQSNTRDLEQLASWIESGDVRPIVGQVYGLEEMTAAHRQSESPNRRQDRGCRRMRRQAAQARHINAAGTMFRPSADFE
jgi:NADPH:quinone reductase-like Zn-dependent oxidoreductase